MTRKPRNINASASKRVKLGEVVIDSGTLLLIDPAHMPRTAEETERFRATCLDLLWCSPGKPVLPGGQVEGGVLSRTGLGDGLYSVTATVRDVDALGSRVVKLEIEFVD